MALALLWSYSFYNPMSNKPLKKGKSKKSKIVQALPTQFSVDYGSVLSDIVTLLENARRAAARSVTAIMTATYWEIGRRIVEQDQKGAKRAGYGQELLERLSMDLGAKFGRGFSRQNLQQMRQFYSVYTLEKIRQTVSGKFDKHPVLLTKIAEKFPLSWSHYVRLMQVKNENARKFYEE